MIAHVPSKVKPVRPIGYRFNANPCEVIRVRPLSSTAKLLFGVILDDARRRPQGVCKHCNAVLADRIGRDVGTVKRRLAELEASGYIARDLAAGGRIRLAIRITWAGVEPPVERATSQEHRGAQRAQGVARMQPTLHSSPSSRVGEKEANGLSALGAEPAQETEADLAAKAELDEVGPAEYLRRVCARNLAAKRAPQTPPDEPARRHVRSVEPPTPDAAWSGPGSAIARGAGSPREVRRPLPCPAPETTTARRPRMGDGPANPHNPTRPRGRSPEYLR